MNRCDTLKAFEGSRSLPVCQSFCEVKFKFFFRSFLAATLHFDFPSNEQDFISVCQFWNPTSIINRFLRNFHWHLCIFSSFSALALGPLLQPDDPSLSLNIVMVCYSLLKIESPNTVRQMLDKGPWTKRYVSRKISGDREQHFNRFFHMASFSFPPDSTGRVAEPECLAELLHDKTKISWS